MSLCKAALVAWSLLLVRSVGSVVLKVVGSVSRPQFSQNSVGNCRGETVLVGRE